MRLAKATIYFHDAKEGTDPKHTLDLMLEDVKDTDISYYLFDYETVEIGEFDYNSDLNSTIKTREEQTFLKYFSNEFKRDLRIKETKKYSGKKIKLESKKDVEKAINSFLRDENDGLLIINTQGGCNCIGDTQITVKDIGNNTILFDSFSLGRIFNLDYEDFEYSEDELDYEVYEIQGETVYSITQYFHTTPNDIVKLLEEEVGGKISKRINVKFGKGVNYTAVENIKSEMIRAGYVLTIID